MLDKLPPRPSAPGRPWREALVVLVLHAACGNAPAVEVVAPARPPVATATPTAQAAPRLVAIELYGTAQLTQEQMLARHGGELRAFGEALMRGDPATDAGPLLEKLDALGDFADIIPSIVGYHEPGGMTYYLTIDFVDQRDAARRMPFRPAPTGAYPDPEGLLADWRAYEAKVTALQAAGAMRLGRADCPALHCLGDPAHPDVQPLAARLAARAPAQREALAAILRGDRDARHRAAAAYLLAYAPDGPAVVQWMIEAFRDSEALVRNNAMRVIADVARYHREHDVPLEPVLEALDYPATLDRNKAAAILAALLEQPGKERLYPLVAARAGATLLAMLRLQQPNNHGFAHRILKTLRGRDLGARDYAAWEAWLRTPLRAATRAPDPLRRGPNPR